MQRREDQECTPQCGLFIPGLSFSSLKIAKTKMEAQQNQVFRQHCSYFQLFAGLQKHELSLSCGFRSSVSGFAIDWQIPVSKGTEFMKLKLFWVWSYIQFRTSFPCFGKKWGVYVCVFVYAYACLPCSGFTCGGNCKCAFSFLMVSLYKTNTIYLEVKSLAKDSSNGFVLSKFNAICFGQQLQLWKEAIHLLPKITQEKRYRGCLCGSGMCWEWVRTD